MSAHKKIVFLVLLISIGTVYLMLYSYVARHWLILDYPMSQVIAPKYEANILFYFLVAGCICLPLLIIAYNIKNKQLSYVIIIVASVVALLSVYFSVDMLSCYKTAKTYFDPKTVQSTMIEVDLQQFESMQANNENAMIYVGRPSCPHCVEIKPNLDILVNNSHSLVYYYNTEQDRENNYDEMQAVLGAYGVDTVPALVILQEAGETQEVYFDEDIIDYFLDTSRFKY